MQQNKLYYRFPFVCSRYSVIISNRLSQHNNSYPHSTSRQQYLLRAKCYLPSRTLGTSHQAVAGFSE